MNKLAGAISFLSSILFSSTLIADDNDLLDYNVKKLNDNVVINLKEAFKGKALLVVNTASKCAFTGQYEDLEALHEKYRGRGLYVLGFPSLDFGSQEFTKESATQDFCRTTYGVQFPMFSTAKILGDNPDPFWKQLRAVSGVTPKWNFYKYLIDKDGNFVEAFPSHISPKSKNVIDRIEKVLLQ